MCTIWVTTGTYNPAQTIKSEILLRLYEQFAEDSASPLTAAQIELAAAGHTPTPALESCPE